MSLTNPTPIVYQNLDIAIKQMSSKKIEKPTQDKGLLAPKKQRVDNNKDDILNPSRRIASYVELIQKKREEIKNGTA